MFRSTDITNEKPRVTPCTQNYFPCECVVDYDGMAVTCNYGTVQEIQDVFRRTADPYIFQFTFKEVSYERVPADFLAGKSVSNINFEIGSGTTRTFVSTPESTWWQHNKISPGISCSFLFRQLTERNFFENQWINDSSPYATLIYQFELCRCRWKFYISHQSVIVNLLFANELSKYCQQQPLNNRKWRLFQRYKRFFKHAQGGASNFIIF